MSESVPVRAGRTGRRAIRVIVLVNFLLVVAWFGPLNSDKLYRGLRRTGLLDTEVLLEQLWVVGSTLSATALFACDLVRKARGTLAARRTTRALVIDALLLSAWWVTLLAICGYFYAVGMGG
jgi:hypothetical protein